MSYINDALHKVQKEKESPYAAYGEIISTEGKKPAAGKKWSSVVGLLIIFFFAAGLVALLYWPDIRKTPRAVTLVPASDVATTQTVQVMPPADVLKTPAPRPSEVKEKKQIAVISGNKIQQEAAPQPALADPGKLFEQALQKQREGRLEEARELYKQVLKKEPRHLQALNNLGVVYLKMKRYKWAIIRFNDALNIQHNYVDAHYNLACLYAQKGDTKQSLFYLKNAMDYNPDVRQWAAQDDDLKNIADLPEFNKILQALDK